MKKIITIILVCLFMVLGVNSESQAKSPSFDVTMNNKSVKVYDVDLLLNNNNVVSDFKPYIHNNRTFVPVRVVAEYFDSEVGWIPESKSVTISKGNNLIIISVDKNEAVKNGELIKLNEDSIPRLVGYPGREHKTMVPLRVVSELLGYDVQWNQERRQASIYEQQLERPKGICITDIEKINGTSKNEQINIKADGDLRYTYNFEEEKNSLTIQFSNATFDCDGSETGVKEINGHLIKDVEYSSDYSNNTSELKIHLNRLVEPKIKNSSNNQNLNISFTNQVTAVRPIKYQAQDAILVEGVKSSEYNIIKLKNPFRYVIDIQDAAFLSDKDMEQYDISMEFVSGVRASQFNPDQNYNSIDNIVRIVLDSKSGISDAEVKLVVEKDDLIIIPKPSTATSITKPETEDSYDAPKNPVTDNKVDEKEAFDSVKKEEVPTRKPRIKPNSKKDVKVVIDAGHGGRDPGAVQKGVQEKKLNLDVALKTENLLKAEGYNVIMTRKSDHALNIYDRPKVANESNAHVFLSIHFNSSPNHSANGIETLYAPRDLTSVKSDAQYPLTQLIHNELIKQTKMNDRGIKQRADLVVLRHTEMPAVLVELGFMSNSNDLQKIQTEAHKDACARAMADGIIKYINETYNLK